MENTFFAILRDALWRSNETIPESITEEEITPLLAMAEKQAVSGLVIDALFRHDVRMPQSKVFECVGLSEQIKKQSGKVSKAVCELNYLLTQHNVQYVVVKGQTVASYYPEPLLRQSGDIDYYCDAENFQKGQEAVANAWNVEPERDDSDKHIHFDYKGVIYEGHFSLASLYGSKRDAYWQNLLDGDKATKVNINGENISTLSPTLHVLYVFLHLYHHLLALGVGLRQFCDLAVMLKNNDNLNESENNRENLNLDELREHLKALGLERAFRAFGSILVDYLGLPEKALGYSLTAKDRRYGKKILDVVMYRGNMGHYNKLGGFRGWKHKAESISIKLSHFWKFWPLAPGYTCGWLWHEIRRSF